MSEEIKPLEQSLEIFEENLALAEETAQRLSPARVAHSRSFLASTIKVARHKFSTMRADLEAARTKLARVVEAGNVLESYVKQLGGLCMAKEKFAAIVQSVIEWRAAVKDAEEKPLAQRVRAAIEKVLESYDDESWRTWAYSWLAGDQDSQKTLKMMYQKYPDNDQAWKAYNVLHAAFYLLEQYELTDLKVIYCYSQRIEKYLVAAGQSCPRRNHER